MTSSTTEYTSRELAEQTADMLNRDSGHSVAPALDDDQRLYSSATAADDLWAVDPF